MATQRKPTRKPVLASARARESPTPSELILRTPEVALDGEPLCQPQDEAANREVQREAQRQTWFQEKINDILDIPNGYESVAVLIIRWDESIDEFQGHGEEIARLEALFRNKFHYKCDTVRLKNNKKPQNALNSAITRHIEEYDGPNNLLIIYYTGHGNSVKYDEVQRLELSATQTYVEKRNTYPATAFWDEAENPLRLSAEGDVLSILDCCFASSAALKCRNEEFRTYFLLAASAANGPTLGPGEESFTTALIESMIELLGESEGGSFPVTKLWERINMKRKTNAALIWDRLHKYKRSLQLAPLDPDRSMRRKSSNVGDDPEQASLVLRLSLTKDDLAKPEIEKFAHHFNEACKESKIPIRRIDWVKMEPKLNPNMSFHMAVRVLNTAQCWKNKSSARRQSEGEQADRPSSTSKRRSIETLSSNSPSKRRASMRLRSNPPTPISPRSAISFGDQSASPE